MADGPTGDKRTISSYDAETTDLLLGIAADVLRSFGSAFGGRHLAIIGGLVPTLLVPEPPEDIDAHPGTGDIDLHLSLHLLDGETSDYYQSIIDGLARLGLSNGERGGRTTRWRWVGRYREVALVVDLLCPTRERPGRPEAPADGTVAERNIGPHDDIAAIAVSYGHLVPTDTVTLARRVPAAGGALTFDFPVAGITSWLCLKADGIQQRDKAKDAFDVVWLIRALGPEDAAAAIAASPLFDSELADETRDQLTRLVDDLFLDADSIGPGQYATFMESPDSAALRRDALSAVRLLGNELRHHSILPQQPTTES